MDKKGSALIFGLVVVSFLTVLSASYCYKSVNEALLSRRHVGSMQAFWAAEAGLGEAAASMPAASVSGTISSGVSYSAATAHLNGTYYQVTSVGTVSVPGGSVNRTVQAVIDTNAIDPSKFKYAIETTVKLTIHGSVDIQPAGSAKEYSSINFADRFSFSKEEIKAYSTVYNAIPPAMSGLVWLEPPTGSGSAFSWDLTSNLVGSGILVIEGDVHIAGTVNWDGIIYVIGKLRMSGTPITRGAVLAESGVTVDDTTMTGNVSLIYDQQAIIDALSLLAFIAPETVSWKEL